MTRRQITEDWSIDVAETFQQRVVDEALQMVDVGPPIRTIWLTVWDTDPNSNSIEETMQGIKDDVVNPDAFEHWEEDEADEKRYASWYPEIIEGRQQWSLYAYVVRGNGYVQATFISETEDDKDWALTTWRSLSCSD